MSTHDTEDLRQRRPAQGISQRDPSSAPNFLEPEIGLPRLEQLPWPRNLFGELASIAELMADYESAPASEHTDNACTCGCRAEHKQNVRQTLRSPYGRGFDVM